MTFHVNNDSKDDVDIDGDDDEVDGDVDENVDDDDVAIYILDEHNDDYIDGFLR